MDQDVDNNNDTEKHAHSTFPHASSIPFPFPSAYPQQIDLMHAFLETLRLKEEALKYDEDDNNNDKRSLPSVLFIESPTGTGKSLSLASAALAWLQYREERDVSVVEEAKAKNSNKTVSNKEDPHSWLNGWVPPDKLERQRETRERKKSTQEARMELIKEIDNIRQQCAFGNLKNSLIARRQYVLRDVLTRQQQLMSSSISSDKRARKLKMAEDTPSPKQPVYPKDAFLLDDYRSDQENSQEETENTSQVSFQRRDLSQAGRLLQGSRLDGSAFGNGRPADPYTLDDDDQTFSAPVGSVNPGSGMRKIVYAARTHSQLSQFIHELDKLRDKGHYKNVRVLALGGRGVLCGNASLRGKPEAVLNETCLDMQQSKSSKQTTSPIAGAIVTGKKRRSASQNGGSCGCPLMANRDAVDTLALHLLTEPTDIEDAALLGRSSHTCAYYASRTALAAAQVVVLPYNMLLSPETRKAIGLHLAGSLVLIDEAHNVPEALRQVHSCQVSHAVLTIALDQLKWYTEKYQQRLAGRNIYYLGQLRKILINLQMTFLRKLKHKIWKDQDLDEKMLTGTELLDALGLGRVNIFKILRYMKESRLAQKLLGFANNRQRHEQDRQQTTGVNAPLPELSKHVSSMSVVETMLQKLALTNNEGKFLLDRPKEKDNTEDKQPCLRFVLLQPALFLENVIQAAYAVAFVGGTLQPFSHIAAELINQSRFVCSAGEADTAIRQEQTSGFSRGSYSYVSASFTAFSCGHVVSPSNVLLQCWPTGPTGVRFDFRHASRHTNEQCDELGSALISICESVPYGGVVVFLPSYSYESFLFKRWVTTGLWTKLEQKRKIHREPKSSQQSEDTLNSYSKDADSASGALLFSVIGGKMSEGINFSDDMARCVVVVGLPYPDVSDPVLREKRAAMDSDQMSIISGDDYYQNLCMRAVNQSVGRAIRHANDYACILLLDHRYEADSRVWCGLPYWLKQSTGAASLSMAPRAPHFRQRIEEILWFFEKKQRERRGE